MTLVIVRPKVACGGGAKPKNEGTIIMLKQAGLFGMGALIVLAVNAGCSKKLDCGANAYVNQDPAFCLALPQGYTADKPQGKAPMSMQIRSPGTFGYTVYWNEEGTLEDRGKVIENMAGDSLKLQGKGDLPSGKWWKFRTQQQSTFAVVLVKGSKGVIRCELQNAPDSDSDKWLDSCKSLRAS